MTAETQSLDDSGGALCHGGPGAPHTAAAREAIEAERLDLLALARIREIVAERTQVERILRPLIIEILDERDRNPCGL